MVMVSVGNSCERTHSPSWFAWSEGRHPFGSVLHSSDERGELSQWQHHKHCSIIIIIIIITNIIITFMNPFAATLTFS